MIYEKDIDQISEEDLNELIDNSVSERKKIEYKQSLPGKSDNDKKGFLADISSFANASGGIVIFGILEDNGIPKSLIGIDSTNTDEEILRLENIIRDGIEPRIPGIMTKPIGVSGSKCVLLINIPKSWISPHRVKFGGHDKFYSRSSNGKYPLDVAELRIAFNLSDAYIEKIKKFKLDRISKIADQDMPITFYKTAKTVLHVIPLSSLELAQHYDIKKFVSNHELVPMYCNGWNNRFNLDGLLAFTNERESGSHSYVQLYRSGIIEAVEAELLEPNNQNLFIPSGVYEHKIIESSKNYLSLLKHLGVDLPIYIFLTLVGVKNYKMAVGMYINDHYRNYKIDRDILELPEVLVENYDIKIENLLKTTFDALWNSCGFSHSHNYNDSGEWEPKR